jgi:3-deoxy-D-manno-octulosonate 8-phosphate phosphatase (KDO 8-P phosphatase)
MAERAAVRQFCDLLLAANGAYAALLSGYGS